MVRNVEQLENTISRVRGELMVVDKYLDDFVVENVDLLGGSFDKKVLGIKGVRSIVGGCIKTLNY